MPNPFIERILKIETTDIRLYALIGVAATWSSEIERSIFWCYVAASALPTHQAADTFYQRVQFDRKRRLADKAVHSKLAGTPDDVTWTDLNRRLEDLLGERENDRNLVSHNPLAVNMYVLKAGTQSVVLAKAEISQSTALVKTGKRKPRTVGVPEMADYCERLMALQFDLERFLEAVLELPRSHPERCAWQ
ncbi:MAG: hypothetical protein ACM3ZV_12855 [Bacillota bacterium]